MRIRQKTHQPIITVKLSHCNSKPWKLEKKLEKKQVFVQWGKAEAKEKHRQTDRKIKAENCHTSWQGQLLIERTAGATGNGQKEEEEQEEGYEEWACRILLRMMWQRQVKILAKQNLIAICKAQKVSSFSAPPHRFPCAPHPSLSPLDKWQCLTRQTRHAFSSYANDTDTVPTRYSLPTDEARVIAHATPTTLSALPPSPPFFYLCSPAQFAFLALFALSQWTWSHLTHSVCLLNLQQHWQHTSTEAGGTLWRRGEGQQHQRQLRLRFLLLNAKNTKTPRRNMLHCIDCRKRDMPAPHPHPQPHWPFCTASLPSHAPLSCDTQFATAWTWPNFSFSLIAAPTRFAYNGLPLTAWQRLFIPCNIKGCSGKLVC